MDYAWAITPDRFTKPNGQTVEIDRNNRKIAEVPLDTAREIIRVGRLSAHAQVCDLKEEHAANFRTLMAREAIKKKWSEQQFVFMNQLHMVTVMMLTGQLKLIESERARTARKSRLPRRTSARRSTCTARAEGQGQGGGHGLLEGRPTAGAGRCRSRRAGVRRADAARGHAGLGSGQEVASAPAKK